MGKEKTVAADLEGARPLLNKVRKCGLNLARLTSVCDQEAYPLRIRRDLHFSRFGLRVDWIGRVAEITNRCSLRYQLQQQPNTLRRCFRGQEAYASQIFPGRLRLSTSPIWTGSAPCMKTIGIVWVAALAASAPFVLSISFHPSGFRVDTCEREAGPKSFADRIANRPQADRNHYVEIPRPEPCGTDFHRLRLQHR